MIKSMTGFGNAVVELADKTISIEIRSVNSKNFDFLTRIPPRFREKEPEMRKLAQSILSRGKIELSLSENNGSSNSSVEINADIVKKHFLSMQAVAKDLGLEAGNEVLASVMRIPDVLVSAQSDLDPTEWKEISEGVKEACLSLDSFRIQEGNALDSDFKLRIANIRKYQVEVLPFEESRIETIRARFEKDLSGAVDFSKIDRNRLEQEIIFYLEKLDITEEKVRLLQHLDYFVETIEEGVSQGKKLNFISQEVGRELNTLGSKANHAQIQRLVVMMKDELEKIKEQMLNVL